MLGVTAGQTVIAIGPDHGYARALVQEVGEGGTVVIASPPPDEDAPSEAQVVDEVPAETKADHVLAWVGVVPLHETRKLAGHVGDGGALWLVLPKAGRDKQAAVTEGDVKRAMLSVGWREVRVVQLATDAFAVRFGRRR